MTSEQAALTAKTLVSALGLLALVGAGCGDSSQGEPLVWVGKSGEQLPASTAANVFTVQADVNGTPGPQVLVDTGAPFALLHSKAFGGVVPLGVGRVATMSLGGTILWKVPTVGDNDKEVSIRPNARPFGGILGYMVFGQFAMSFNYRDKLVIVGGAPPPADLLAPTTIPFSLEGGGVGLLPEDLGVLEFPASRIIVPAVIEGTPRTMLLDTGASWVALRTSIFQEIVSDGRGQVSDDATLATGRTTTKVTRLHTVSAGGAEVLGAVAAAGDRVDALLLTLSTEVGHPVDGLLGAPYLREFYVTVDYPGHNVVLRRYASEAHLQDDYVRVGFDVAAAQSLSGTISIVVNRVFKGTDAEAKGIKPGDELLAVNGKSVSEADVVSADRLLVGTAGSSLTLEFSKKTVTVQVEDLLPFAPP